MILHTGYDNEELARTIIQLAKEHKELNCNSSCSISLFPLRMVIKLLVQRKLTEQEKDVLC